MITQGRHATISIVLLPQFRDRFLSVRTELAERKRINPHFIATAPEYGIDVARKETRIAPSDIYIHIIASIQSIDYPFETFYHLYFIKKYIVVRFLISNTRIQILLQYCRLSQFLTIRGFIYIK